jgi:hypothetical protein
MIDVTGFGMHMTDEQLETRLFVKNRRKDGKYSVVYVYPLSGRRIGAILTAEKLAAAKASGEYRVIGA